MGLIISFINVVVLVILVLYLIYRGILLIAKRSVKKEFAPLEEEIQKLERRLGQGTDIHFEFNYE